MAVSMILCGTAMAQISRSNLEANKASFNRDRAITEKQAPIQRDATPVWSCDFEDANAYVITDGTGSVTTWAATSEETYPACNGGQSAGGFFIAPLNCNYDWRPENRRWTTSETPATWMIMNAFEHYAGSGTLNPNADGVWGPMESSINFSNIDLSSCEAPKLTLLQRYDAFNPSWDQMFVETSVDGGATWVSHEVNTETDALDNGDYVMGAMEVLLPEIGNVSSATVRIRYLNVQRQGSYAAQCAWQIDDVKIVPTPAHNLTINDGRISMFGYLDYRNVPAEYWTSMTDSAKREYAYQIYDPYAQTPAANWETSGGYAAFNVEVTNNGALSATPKANIVVTSPSGAELYNKTLTGTELASTVGDTIDFGYIDENVLSNSTIFYFEDDIEYGRYTVTFTVLEDGFEDADPSDNTISQYFYITEKNYSKSYFEPTTSFSANAYTISQSGDMYGAQFLYYYSPDDIMTADLYIADGTTPGTQVKIQLYHQGTETYEQARESEWVEITEEMLGTWINFTFTNEYNFSFETDEQYREVTVMAVAAWDNDDDRIYFGKSNVLSTKGHNSMKHYMAYEEDWYYGSDDIALTFHSGEGVSVPEGVEPPEPFVSSFSASEIEMYPNPSNGIVNFTNVENATIEVYNMMGQVVASVNNANDNASIDLSGAANGNYIVRIVKDGAIATSKLNIVK